MREERLGKPVQNIKIAAPLWAAGQLAVQVFRDLPSLLLLFYMTQVLTIPPAMAGVAIFVPKLFWAIICDSTIGFVSDRLRDRFPRRHFLLIGAVLVPFALILLFGGANAVSASGRALTVAFMLAFYMFVFSLFSVPHLAIGTEMGRTPQTGAMVMGWRGTFAAFGVLVGASIAPILLQRLGGGAHAYKVVALVMAAAGSVSLVISWFGAGEAPRPPRDETPRISAFQAIVRNRAFLVLFVVLLIQLSASGMSYASLTYLFTFNLAYPEPLTVVGLFGLVAALVAAPSYAFWVWVAKKIGKKAGLIWASSLYVVAFPAVMLLPPGKPLPCYALAVAIGILNPGSYLNIYAMLADLVEKEREEEGFSRAGLYSGIFTAGEKIGFAVGGTLLAGTVLGAFGFLAGSNVQSASAQTGILLAFAILPSAMFLVTVAIVALGMKSRRTVEAQG